MGVQDLMCRLLMLLLSAWQVCSDVNPYNFTTTLTSDPCLPDDDVIIVVHSTLVPKYSRRRIACRSSWLNAEQLSSKLGLKVKIIFMLGMSANPDEQRFAEYESEMYGDIVQYDFMDSYHNNTYKAMSYLRWITDHGCLNASLLIKLDDDALLKESRIAHLSNIIHRLRHSSVPVYAGRFISNKPMRNEKDKSYIPYSVYPYEFYPTWYQGLVYFLTPSLAPTLFHTALNTTYMFTDDVYVGILVDRIASEYNVSRINLKQLSLSQLFQVSDQDLLKLWCSNNPVPLYHVPDPRRYWYWYRMRRPDSCFTHTESGSA